MFANWSCNPIIRYRWLSISATEGSSVPTFGGAQLFYSGKKWFFFLFSFLGREHKNRSLPHTTKNRNHPSHTSSVSFCVLRSPFSGERAAPLNRRYTNRRLLSITRPRNHRTVIIGNSTCFFSFKRVHSRGFSRRDARLSQNICLVNVRQMRIIPPRCDIPPRVGTILN